MIKNIIYKGFATLAIATSLLSCDKGFDELNVNPNDPSAETADPKMLITPVLKDAVFTAHLHQRIHNLYIDNYSQYYNGPIAAVQLGNVADGWTQDFWVEHYKWLNALNTVIRLNKDVPEQANMVATAMVYKAFITSRATDLFGDIPYFDAANGTGDIPKYDTQEEIYKHMLLQLAEAVTMFDASKATMGGNDFIYNGDVSKWVKFANSLRLRLAMRISNVEPALAKANAEAAVKGGVFEMSDDSALMISDGSFWGQGYSTKYYFDWGSGNGVGMTTTMFNMLAGYEMDFPSATDLGIPEVNNVPAKVDPRALHYFYVTNQNSDITPDKKDEDGNVIHTYKGNWTAVDHGISRDEAQDVNNFVANNSRVGVEMHGDITRKFIIMPAHEVWFLRAEATERFGWDMMSSAKASYEQGITLSINQWNEGAHLSAYLTSTNPNQNGTSVDYDNVSGVNNSKLDKIITQKYISGFPDNGWEAWADQRRLDHTLIQKSQNPDMETGLGSKNDYVQRLKYPSNQPSVNGVNYEEAVARQGEDLVSTEMWWAK